MLKKMSNKSYHITQIDLTSWKCTLNRNLISSEIFQIEAWMFRQRNQDVLQNRWSESLLRRASSMSVSLLDWKSWVPASEKAANPCHLHMFPMETEPGRRQNKTIHLLWQCLDKLSMSIRTEEFLKKICRFHDLPSGNLTQYSYNSALESVIFHYAWKTLRDFIKPLQQQDCQQNQGNSDQNTYQKKKKQR